MANGTTPPPHGAFYFHFSGLFLILHSIKNYAIEIERIQSTPEDVHDIMHGGGTIPREGENV